MAFKYGVRARPQTPDCAAAKQIATRLVSCTLPIDHPGEHEAIVYGLVRIALLDAVVTTERWTARWPRGADE